MSKALLSEMATGDDTDAEAGAGQTAADRLIRLPEVMARVPPGPTLSVECSVEHKYQTRFRQDELTNTEFSRGKFPQFILSPSSAGEAS
ncbi:MAG: hypothetical protein E6Q98_23435 [Rhodospirillaceae bacterium]|nr:MAG: hypothetical protein E6Q98_23435 [Rhodospirillaceae bacterium]